MRLFEQKRKASKEHDVLAHRIAKRILSWQSALAEQLNKHTVHLSQGQKKLFLVAVCAVLGGLNIYLILHAIL